MHLRGGSWTHLLSRLRSPARYCFTPDISLSSQGSEYMVLSYSVKGRKVGQGRCGQYFLFVD
jgi:hypothetical protein